MTDDPDPQHPASPYSVRPAASRRLGLVPDATPVPETAPGAESRLDARAGTPVAEVTELPMRPTPRLGRGIRWSDLVAEMHRERVDREAAA
ncbi:hypothetical protein CFN78_17140 [Amycolatopsis antarctica]|uniref:Uncharacterized protein n=1 Tax=Amycolatopsis antarctica TaxID=1854586 RepID=A0A263D0B7_9PSEU|nr:DUF6222 family protein [Amycolatopsis antarctica]OZM71880.1 hypothetical protein CFN78_17140 [Amycolatopsis antarctica]